MTQRNLSRATTAAESSPSAVPAPPPAELLPPQPTVDDAEELECPSCCSTVLPSDFECAGCGLKRMWSRPDPGEEEATSSQAAAATVEPSAASDAPPPKQPVLPMKPALRNFSGRSVLGDGRRISFAEAVVVIPTVSYKLEALWTTPSGAAPRKAKAITPSVEHTRRRGRPPAHSSPVADAEPVVAAEPPSSCSALGQVGEAEPEADSRPIWRGGTLAPPPYLCGAFAGRDPPFELSQHPSSSPSGCDGECTGETSSPDQPQESSTAPTAASTIACSVSATALAAAKGKREARRVAKLNQLDGASAPDVSASRSASSASASNCSAASATPIPRPPSSAEARIAALLARVRAKSSG